jgi:hypothetical protein
MKPSEDFSQEPPTVNDEFRNEIVKASSFIGGTAAPGMPPGTARGCLKIMR